MLNVFPISKSRYINVIKWRARSIAPRLYDWPQQFIPFNAERTDMNNCIMSNGIPKAGTHLLDSLIGGLERWANIGAMLDEVRYENELTDVERSVRYCVQQSAIKKLRNGQKATGHLPWTRALGKSMGQVTSSRRIMHLLMYRDPRDVFASHLRYYYHPEMFAAVDNPDYIGGHPHIERNGQTREQWSSDDEVLTWILERPVHCQNARYEQWLDSPNCLPIRFEDLFSEILDLPNNVLGPVLKKIFDYLEIDSSPINLPDLYHRVYGQSHNFSSEKEKIGQYKKIFKDQHYAMIDNPEFKRILDVYGYEW